MKMLLLTTLLWMVIPGIQSCQKDNTADGTDIAGAIIGTWELRQTSGGLGTQVNDYPPGNGNMIKFTNTRYENYENGVLVKSGTYTVIDDASVNESVCLEFAEGQFTHRIIYDNNYNDTRVFVEIVQNKLNFISGCYSLDAGYSSIYEKQ